MLLNHDRKIVILTPFKCWSTSVCSYFTAIKEWECIHTLHPYMSGDCRNHMKGYELCGTHGNVVPNKYLNYKRLLLIRNPYDRVVSMWKWVSKIHPRDFNTYFYDGAEWPTCFPVTKNYPYEGLIKVENLFDDFQKFGIEVDPDKFPRMNYVDDLSHDLNPLQKEIIFWFHKSDFDAGNYDK